MSFTDAAFASASAVGSVVTGAAGDRGHPQGLARSTHSAAARTADRRSGALVRWQQHLNPNRRFSGSWPW